MKVGPNQKVWVEAILELPQVRGTLCGKRDDGERGFCCLGVAVHVLEDAPWKEKVRYFYDDGATQYSYLGPRMVEKLGLHNAAGGIKYSRLDKTRQAAAVYASKGHRSLAAMNDGGLTREEIADFITKYPEAVFRESK